MMSGQGRTDAGIDADEQHAHAGRDAIAKWRGQLVGHSRLISMRYARVMSFIAMLIAVVLAAAVTIGAQTPEPDKSAILNAVQVFFDTMANKDIDGARKILQPQGRFHALRIRDGKPDVH